MSDVEQGETYVKDGVYEASMIYGLSGVTLEQTPRVSSVYANSGVDFSFSGGVFFDLYSISYLWYSATAVAVVVGVGLIVSFFTGNHANVFKQIFNKRYTSTINRSFCFLQFCLL